MAGIRKRAQTWQVRWQQGGEAQCETFALESSAVAFRERVEAAGNAWPSGWVQGKGDVPQSAGASADDRGHTVATWLAWHIASEHSEAQPHVRESLARKMNTRLAGSELADMRLSLVKREHVQAWADSISPRYAHSTMRVTLVTLGAAFDTATRLDPPLIPQTPMVDIRNNGRRTGKNGKKEAATFLTENEEARMIAAVPAEYRLFVRTLFVSGLRYGEAWALFPYSVMDADGVVSLEIAHSRRALKGGTSVLGDTKSGKPRTVTVSPELGAELVAYAATRNPSEPLFDLPNSSSAFALAVWNKARTQANLVGKRAPRIHDTRHTHASRMLAHGMNLVTLSKRLGHASIQITADTYGHLERIDPAAQAIVDKVYG